MSPKHPHIFSAVLLLALPGFAAADAFSDRADRDRSDGHSLGGTPDRLAAGDIARVHDFWIVLESDRVPSCRPERDGAVLVEADGGRVLAVRIDAAGNPLDALTDEEARRVRGVRLSTFSEAVAASLARLDLPRVCLQVLKEAAVAAGRALPPLPGAVRYLVLRDERLVQIPRGENSHGIDEDPGFVDLSGLGRLTGLRLLLADDISLPLEGLKAHRDLRVLVARAAEGDVPALPELRWLDLGCARELRSIAGCRGMPHLRALFLGGTRISDLGPLDAHPALERLDIRETPVRVLPRGRLPRLAEVRAIALRIAREDEARFRAENPGARLELHWKPALLDAVRGADRIELRRPRADLSADAAFVTKDAGEVAAFLDALEIDEASSGGHCMCLGNLDIWFYRGEESLVLMSFHHGQSLRWIGWPGDAELTRASGKALSEWVAACGFPGVLEEWRRGDAERRAAAVRGRRVAEVLPAPVLDRLERAGSEEEAVAAFTGELPDPEERAVVLLRLFGCDEGTWNRFTSLDRLILEDLLPAVGSEAFGRAAERAAKDDAGLRGLGRWIFETGKAEAIPEPALGRVLPAVATHAFAHPRDRNRRRAILWLAEGGSAQGLRILDARLRAPVALRPLAEEEREEPGGWVVYRNETEDLDHAGSDESLVALVLARRGWEPLGAWLAGRLAGAPLPPAEAEALRRAREALAEALARRASKDGEED